MKIGTPFTKADVQRGIALRKESTRGFEGDSGRICMVRAAPLTPPQFSSYLESSAVPPSDTTPTGQLRSFVESKHHHPARPDEI